MIPHDPAMLLSYINTQLRDFYPSLAAFCEDVQETESEIKDKLLGIDYTYDEALNQFV